MERQRKPLPLPPPLSKNPNECASSFRLLSLRSKRPRSGCRAAPRLARAHLPSLRPRFAVAVEAVVASRRSLMSGQAVLNSRVASPPCRSTRPESRARSRRRQHGGNTRFASPRTQSVDDRSRGRSRTSSRRNTRSRSTPSRGIQSCETRIRDDSVGMTCCCRSDTRRTVPRSSRCG